MTHTVRILGIDPGLKCAGWGIIDVTGNRMVHVAHGVVKTPVDMALSDRLCRIFDGITDMIAFWSPTEAAIEETFMNNNAASALKLGQARGAAMLAAAKMNLPVGEYAANKIKKSVVGAGHAEKQQVQMMIKVLLAGVEASTDAADALAVAICHAHHRATAKVLEHAR